MFPNIYISAYKKLKGKKARQDSMGILHGGSHGTEGHEAVTESRLVLLTT